MFSNNEEYLLYNAQSTHNAKNPDDIQDFINSPSLIASKTNYAFDSAGCYWGKNKIDNYADNDNVEQVSRKVNLPYGKIEKDIQKL